MISDPQYTDWWPFERRMLRRDQLVIERYDGTDGYQRRYSQRFVDAAVLDELAGALDARVGDDDRERIDAFLRASGFGS